MRIYFSLPNSSFLRNLEPVIRLLLQRGHDVILGLGEEKGSSPYLEDLVASTGTGRVIVTGPPQWSEKIRRSSRWLPFAIDYLFFLAPVFDQAPYSRLKRARKTPEFVHRLIKRYRLRYGWRRRAALTWLRLVEEAVPATDELVEHFRLYQPDVLVVSPLLGADSHQLEHVRAAKVLRIPSLYAVHSWDNLTSKGLIRLRPEGIAVWNQIQEREAVELHRQRRRRVFITGAYNFDDWFVAKPSMDRAAFLRRVDLPPDRALILYLCSALHFSKLQPEEAFVVEWVQRLRLCNDQRLAEAAVLIRPHPKRLDEFTDLRIFGGDQAVAVWPREGELPVGEERKHTFFDSLYHANAAVALNTTAMIDAAVVGRPVYTILDARNRLSQEMTLHFSYLTEPGMRVLQVADNWAAHWGQLSEALRSRADTAQAENFVQAFVRPWGLNQTCAPKLVDRIEVLASEKKIARLWGVWLRPIALRWLNLVNRRAELAGTRANSTRTQSLEAWQKRRMFLDGLRARAGIRAGV